MQAVPGRWSCVGESFRSAQFSDELTASYPTQGFKGSLQRLMLETSGRDPGRYRTSAKPFLRSLDPAMAGYLRDDDRVPSPEAGRSTLVHEDSLAPIWRRFGEDLLSDAYRAAISELTQVDVSSAPLQADFEVGELGSWYHAHRDLGRRAVSHIFYFNPQWEAEWGGNLRLLEGRDIDMVVAEVAPVSGTSVLMVHRNDLWHGTLPLRRPGVERRSLHVWFWA
jgi:hypothetical protein